LNRKRAIIPYQNEPVLVHGTEIKKTVARTDDVIVIESDVESDHGTPLLGLEKETVKLLLPKTIKHILNKLGFLRQNEDEDSILRSVQEASSP
jgi:hypothetical protein